MNEMFGMIQVWWPVGLLVGFWVWESWAPFFDFRRGRILHAVRNLGIVLINMLVVTLCLAPLVFMSLEYTVKNHWGILNQLKIPWAVGMLLAIVLQDGWMYWWHRLNHLVPWLWRCHRMHHSDVQMDVTTATRFHTLELLMSRLLIVGLIPVFGLQLQHLVIYEMCLVFQTKFHHANISLGSWDKWLRLILVTPDMHKVHHSREVAETNSNYGTLFSFWDTIWGSSKKRNDPATIEFGLHDFQENYWQTITGMLLTPFRRGEHSQPVKEVVPEEKNSLNLE